MPDFYWTRGIGDRKVFEPELDLPHQFPANISSSDEAFFEWPVIDGKIWEISFEEILNWDLEKGIVKGPKISLYREVSFSLYREINLVFPYIGKFFPYIGKQVMRVNINVSRL